MKLLSIGPRVTSLDGLTARPPPKEADALYLSADYKVWRETVIKRAGGRCQAIDRGRRCKKAMPAHRMFADHKVEVKDGGARFDPANGWCLCGSHHTAKTAAARAARRWA